jgi:hypothetical protein
MMGWGIFRYALVDFGVSAVQYSSSLMEGPNHACRHAGSAQQTAMFVQENDQE